MSLFQRFPNNDIAPLFRLLDDYSTQGSSGFSSAVRAFTPKFDVREHKDTYELHGELPGIDQKDVHIEFADPHTLVIKGHVEREYSSDRAGEARGRIAGDVTDAPQPDHKAKVEDEDAESKKDQGEKKDADKNTQVSKKSDHHHHSEGGAKYWVSERSVGEFHRAFSFPSRVDQDNVKARLNNGILIVTVPKATEHKSKRIEVE